MNQFPIKHNFARLPLHRKGVIYCSWNGFCIFIYRLIFHCTCSLLFFYFSFNFRPIYSLNRFPSIIYILFENIVVIHIAQRTVLSINFFKYRIINRWQLIIEIRWRGRLIVILLMELDPIMSLEWMMQSTPYTFIHSPPIYCNRISWN